MCPTGKPRWKRAAALLLAVLLCVGLSGCLKHPLHYTYWEVLAYLKEKFPGETVQVSRKYYEEPDSKYKSRTERVWDCYFADMPEVVFHVRSSWRTWLPNRLLPVASYILENDVDQAFWQYYLEQYLADVGSLDAWENVDYQLEMEFSSMEQVYPAAKQLQAFYIWFSSQPHAGQPSPAKCSLAGLPLPVFRLDDCAYVSCDCAEERIDTLMVHSCAALLKGYYAFYRLPCPGYMPEKVYAYARDTWQWDSGYKTIQYNGEPIPSSTFTGVGVKSYFVSYGGFYEMLSRLDIAVEGTPEHFSLTGLDGCLYEFSYEFYDEENGDLKWYFTRDGEKLSSNSSFYASSEPLLYLEDGKLYLMAGLVITLVR